jgi:hypothetical protein
MPSDSLTFDFSALSEIENTLDEVRRLLPQLSDFIDQLFRLMRENNFNVVNENNNIGIDVAGNVPDSLTSQ